VTDQSCRGGPTCPPLQLRSAVRIHPLPARADTQIRPVPARADTQIRPVPARADTQIRPVPARADTQIRPVPTRANTQIRPVPTRANTQIRPYNTGGRTHGIALSPQGGHTGPPLQRRRAGTQARPYSVLSSWTLGAGKATSKTAPFPSAEVKLSDPPDSSISFLDTARPRPVPELPLVV